MNYWLWSIPIISAFIGWVTNWIAIKMLFHPRKPIKILGVTIQGIFPKRQQQFAEKLGQLVGQELLSFKDIEQQITHVDQLQKIYPIIELHIDHFLRNKLKEKIPMIGMFIGDKTINTMKEALLEELQIMMPSMLKNYLQSIKDSIDIEQQVLKKVSNFSMDKLEKILYQLMSKEFKFVEIIGAVLGFIIGVLQVGITLVVT